MKYEDGRDDGVYGVEVIGEIEGKGGNEFE